MFLQGHATIGRIVKLGQGRTIDVAGEPLAPGDRIMRAHAALTEEEAIGVGCAFRSGVAGYERLGGINFQENVVIQGAGPIGLYSCLMAIEGGAGQVMVAGDDNDCSYIVFGRYYFRYIKEVMVPN